MSEFINIQNENPIIINKIKFYEDEQQVEIPTVVKQNDIQDFSQEFPTIEGNYTLNTDNCMFSNVEKNNTFYEDYLELIPILTKNSVDLNKDKPLLKNNYLSEFKTDKDKYQVRHNLGINYFEILNQLNEITESGNYIAHNTTKYIPLIVFNTPEEIYQISFIGINSIYKRIGIKQNDQVIWSDWNDVVIPDNSITLSKLANDVAQDIINTKNKTNELNISIDTLSQNIVDIFSLLKSETGLLKKIQVLEQQIVSQESRVSQLEQTVSNIPSEELVDLITTVSENTNAIQQEVLRATSVENELLQLINKTVYLTQKQYDDLVKNQQILDDVEYNIFEDE